MAATILDQIVAAKHREIEQAKRRAPESSLRPQLAKAPPARDFFAAVSRPGAIRLIAEVKKASPSKGVIRQDFDAVAIAQGYELGGAAAISVLTDAPFFRGSLNDLKRVRAAVSLPVLRKDFILDRYQLLEARAAGADAVLLIAECLDDCRLRMLYREALELGLTPLVEFYDPQNAQRVVDAGATFIGVNNRDLHSFQVDLRHVVRMRASLPAECTLVAESGIAGPEDARWLQEQGIDAMLVGESLVKQRDVEAAVRNLLSLL